jgi:hypothetical protein
MGVGLFAMFEFEIAGADSFSTGTDGKSVAAATPLLDRIALDKGLTLFTRFIPDLEELAELALKSPRGTALPETWFDPHDGLKTVSQLIRALSAEKKWGKGWSKRDIEAVVAGLELLQKDLKVARRKKTRFCLSFS